MHYRCTACGAATDNCPIEASDVNAAQEALAAVADGTDQVHPLTDLQRQYQASGNDSTEPYLSLTVTVNYPDGYTPTEADFDAAVDALTTHGDMTASMNTRYREITFDAATVDEPAAVIAAASRMIDRWATRPPTCDTSEPRTAGEVTRQAQHVAAADADAVSDDQEFVEAVSAPWNDDVENAPPSHAGSPGAQWRLLVHDPTTDISHTVTPTGPEHDPSTHEQVHVIPGEFDELVAGRFAHLEQMSDDEWWINIGGVTLFVAVTDTGTPTHVTVYGPDDYDQPVPGCGYDVTWSHPNPDREPGTDTTPGTGAPS